MLKMCHSNGTFNWNLFCAMYGVNDASILHIVEAIKKAAHRWFRITLTYAQHW